MKKLTPELIAELRAQATEFAKQIGIKSCTQDCSACWLYRSDVPCPQRDIINAYIAGGEAVMKIVNPKD